MLYLMSTPRVYNKLKMVVSEAISKGGISSPIRQEEAKAIPYIQVRKEHKCCEASFPPPSPKAIKSDVEYGFTDQ